MANKSTTVGPVSWHHGVKFIDVTFVADDTDASMDTGTITGAKGMQLHSVSINAGATGPTVNSDLQIADSLSGVDLIGAASNGANIVDSDDSTTYALAEDTTHMVHGNAVLTITNNAVNSATTVITCAFIKIK